MITTGQLCVKIAGRDAGKKCVIVDVDKDRVLIDGETRRRKCNPVHLEPLEQKLEIKKGAEHADVVKAFKTIGVEIKEPVKRAKKAAAPEKKA